MSESEDKQSHPQVANDASVADNPSALNGGKSPVVKEPLVSQKKGKNISWIWLVPFIAAIVGISLLVRDYIEQGPEATIIFNTAEGLEVGKTQVRYKDVVIGHVSRVGLTPDRNDVEVDVNLSKESEFLMQKGTRFWVVKPRLSLSGVSGLGTLVSGSYIGVDTPDDTVEHPVYTDEFIGLEHPPEISSNRPGKKFVLNATNLGSLDIGSPVYYRRIPVGQVINYQLAKDGKAVNILIFIDSPYDQFVTENSRFWNASGLDFSLGASGLNFRTQSLVSLMSGGVAFAEPPGRHGQETRLAEANSVFLLATTEERAMSDPHGQAYPVRMKFSNSVRGLQAGAPLDFKGINLGEVRAVSLEYDPKTKESFAVVDAIVYENRMGVVLNSKGSSGGSVKEIGLEEIKGFFSSGLRGQLRYANILTGQLYVALDYFPNEAPLPEPDLSQDPFIIPTVGGSFDQIQDNLTQLIRKLKDLPLDSIGQSLDSALQGVAKLVENLDTKTMPEVNKTLRQASRSLNGADKLVSSMDDTIQQNGPLMSEIHTTLRELTRTMRSFRAISDFLQAEPSSVIRGRQKDQIPFME
ncbi:intermembrane transport protein PqiB [Advenella sp. RU8]|uniref:PqiB family protein n=1 Tax=Advenella sp. RU8 TaxID=3399575 RepID=UPI003AADE2BE